MMLIIKEYCCLIKLKKKKILIKKEELRRDYTKYLRIIEDSAIIGTDKFIIPILPTNIHKNMEIYKSLMMEISGFKIIYEKSYNKLIELNKKLDQAINLIDFS